jgi:hypothetical protein
VVFKDSQMGSDLQSVAYYFRQKLTTQKGNFTQIFLQAPFWNKCLLEHKGNSLCMDSISPEFVANKVYRIYK